MTIDFQDYLLENRISTPFLFIISLVFIRQNDQFSTVGISSLESFRNIKFQYNYKYRVSLLFVNVQERMNLKARNVKIQGNAKFHCQKCQDSMKCKFSLPERSRFKVMSGFIARKVKIQSNAKFYRQKSQDSMTCQVSMLKTSSQC